MSDQIPCSRCGSTSGFEIVEKNELVTIKGKEVSFFAHYTRCLACGDIFEVAGQLDQNLDAAREAYKKAYDAPTREDLIALRAKYNASQKAFGMILGFGELTMNSYEQGAIPDPTNRLLLALAETPSIFKAMYDINCDRIGAIQRGRIEESRGYKDAIASMNPTVRKTKRAKCA